MISQRRFKTIDDYPSKFDWPGIKGLKIKKIKKIKKNEKVGRVRCNRVEVIPAWK